MTLPLVNPGDLITSEDWNALVSAVNDLAARVADLEAGGSKSPPRIVQVLPADVMTAGDRIHIYGSNFGYTQGAASVFFGKARAAALLSGSTDTHLIVQLPDPVEGATPAGTAMTMTVGNLYDFTSKSITVKSKPVVVTGGIEFTYLGSQPTTPAQNQSIFYRFELKSFASQPLMVTITPTFKDASQPGATPDFSKFYKIIDSDDTEHADGQVSLDTGATKIVRIRVDIPDKADGAKFSMSATASAPGVSSVVETLPDQQVGQPGEQPDQTISNFKYDSTTSGSATLSTDTGGVSGVDGTLIVAKGTTATIEMRTEFDKKYLPPGVTTLYDLNATVDTPSGGWSTSVDSSMQNPLPITDQGGLVMLDYNVTAPQNDNKTILRLTLTRRGVTKDNKRSVAYRLQIK